MPTPLPKYRINASTFEDIIGDLTHEIAEVRYIKKNGGAMTGPLVVPTPTAPEHAATKAYADARIPPGIIMPWGGAANTAPAGWLICNGATTLSRTTYADLYAVVGVTYGSSSGTTFGVPSMPARAPVGLDGSAEFTTLGEMSGAPTVTLTAAMVPNITGQITMHNQAGPTIAASANGVFAGFQGSATLYHSHSTATTGANSYGGYTLSSGGGGAAHDNKQPYLVVQYIIKY